MSHTLSRRNFITSTIAGLAAGCVMSVEEHRLLAATLAPAPPRRNRWRCRIAGWVRSAL